MNPKSTVRQKEKDRSALAAAPGMEEEFAIVATSVVADDRTRLLKDGETFAVFDRHGDIHSNERDAQGLYHEGTRFLSALELRLGNSRPLLLSSTETEDNAVVAVDLTNPDILTDGQVAIPRGTLHLFRSKFLWEGACYERLRLSNYGLAAVTTTLSLHFAADFCDIFEVRGKRRERRGLRHPSVEGDQWIVYRYEGLDGVIRRTRVDFSASPASRSPSTVRFNLALQPKEEMTVFLTLSCDSGQRFGRRLTYDRALARARKTQGLSEAQGPHISTSNEQFNAWLDRSLSDLRMMTTATPQGLYPYAGVPWFSCPFGRDGIITALELLWANPAIARGVLAYLAATQATEVIPEQDAEPGKILHEARKGEMANLGEIPFGRYYGSVDATPLFVMLAGAYFERTGDHDVIKTLWPSIDLALRWIDAFGDPDGDGFIEYARRSLRGLVHQGWKDSSEAVFHADGTLAEGPIALCEIQGYVYAAKRSAASLASVMGETQRANALSLEAQRLKERFERTFWCDELATYALALDGSKRPCLVRASNAGHGLFTGIASPDHARLTTRTLLGEDFFSGWGIRTLASSEPRFNPMSYHNGSVWPHDNALIAAGMARYGLKDEALRIFSGLFDAALFLDLHRLPELFCGFARRPGEGPSLYPVACSPQSWSVVTVFLLLQACLGLSVNGAEGRVEFFSPCLPEFLEWVQVKNLRVGNAELDLFLKRHADDVVVSILRRKGQVEVSVKK